MKTLLTVIACGNEENTQSPCDGIEILYPENGEDEKQFLTRAVKNANGKYSVICESTVTFHDVQPVLNIIDKNTNDLLCFTGGVAVKNSILKNVVKDCTDAFSCRIFSVLGCKTLLKTVYTPFIFTKQVCVSDEASAEGLLLSCGQFSKVKAKLPKEIYSYAFNMLCEKLVLFYMRAMLDIKEGKLSEDKLIAFDNKLKAEIVLYLALEKRFTAAKLQKLRDKNFKISVFKVNKFKKLLK